MRTACQVQADQRLGPSGKSMRNAASSVGGEVVAKPFCVRPPLLGSHELRVRPGCIELVIGIPGKYVHVVVPGALVACGLVVLPRGDSLAPVGAADRDRDVTDQIMHRMPRLGGQPIQVLVVPDRRWGSNLSLDPSGVPLVGLLRHRCASAGVAICASGLPFEKPTAPRSGPGSASPPTGDVICLWFDRWIP